MITSVSGTVLAMTATALHLDAGVFGLELHATARCLGGLTIGQRVSVPAHLVVREDGWTLYGFADTDERVCFNALLQAKGVGPKVAVGLLGAMTPDQLRRAIATGDAAALTAAPGVGARGAARLVIDLRDRLGPVNDPSDSAPGVAPTLLHGWQEQVQTALIGLGWTAADASAATARVAAGLPDGEPVPEVGQLLRMSLQSLDRRLEAR